MLVGMRAEFARMHNGDRLSGQKQDYPELQYPIVPSDWRHAGILHESDSCAKSRKASLDSEMVLTIL